VQAPETEVQIKYNKTLRKMKHKRQNYK